MGKTKRQKTRMQRIGDIRKALPKRGNGKISLPERKLYETLFGEKCNVALDVFINNDADEKKERSNDNSVLCIQH